MGTIAAFVHIPKNAGSYITWLLRSHFGPRHCRGIASNGEAYSERDLSTDLRLYPRMQCLSGHYIRPDVDFGKHETRLTWATVLRDPMDRFPSHYRWLCKNRAERPTFEQWCAIKGEKFGNYQCRRLAGVPDAEAALRVIRNRHMLVGEQGQLREFLAAWAAREGWAGFPLTDKVVNAAPTREQHDVELIEKYNQADLELFRRCRDEGLFVEASSAAPSNSLVPSRSSYYLNLCKHVALYKPYRHVRDFTGR